MPLKTVLISSLLNICVNDISTAMGKVAYFYIEKHCHFYAKHISAGLTGEIFTCENVGKNMVANVTQSISDILSS